MQALDSLDSDFKVYYQNKIASEKPEKILEIVSHNLTSIALPHWQDHQGAELYFCDTGMIETDQNVFYTRSFFKLLNSYCKVTHGDYDFRNLAVFNDYLSNQFLQVAKSIEKEKLKDLDHNFNIALAGAAALRRTYRDNDNLTILNRTEEIIQEVRNAIKALAQE